MTPSTANTSGLAEISRLLRDFDEWPFDEANYHKYAALILEVTAASAQARISELEFDLQEAQTIDAGFWKWLGERDLQPDGPDVEWGDIVVALTEHEDNAYDVAGKAEARATAAKARADRLAKALVMIGGERPEQKRKYPNSYRGGFDAATDLSASIARAALQQEG